jgi:hypothetical protein
VDLLNAKGVFYDLTRTPARARSLRHEDPGLAPTPPHLPV